jgi:ABC-type transport system involved in multi-copper enzyme maturation permease subunit
LNQISQTIRFFANGILSQTLFMAGYNLSVLHFEHLGYPASTIYAVFYMLYIPIGHLLGCLLVFGWPNNYLASLLSNAPVGLTAMAIGSVLTGFLSKMEFDIMVENWMANQFGTKKPEEEEEGEFYASLVVMVVTGVWTYILSTYVNSTSDDKSAKKDGVALPYGKDHEKEL